MLNLTGYVFVPLGLAAVLLSGCYASGRPPESAKAAFKNVEHGTGKVLEGTGNLINAGVETADRSWETPNQREEEAQRRR